jgi:hypothetical protein
MSSLRPGGPAGFELLDDPAISPLLERIRSRD